MLYEIRPLSFGEILDTSFRLLGRHCLLWLSILSFCLFPYLVAVCGAEVTLGIPIQAALGEMGGGGALQGQARKVLAVAGCIFGVMVICMTIASAAIAAAVTTLYRGGSASSPSAVGAGLRATLPLLGTLLLILSLFGAAGGAAFLLAKVLPGLIAIALALALLAFGTYVYIPLVLLAPIAVLEQTFFLAAWSRCSQLMKGHRSRAWGLHLVATLIYVILVFPLSFFAHLPWIGNLAILVDRALGIAYFSFLAVLLYFDLRCRKEGYDLEQLTEAVAGRADPS